jgi:hypothetical protein
MTPARFACALLVVTTPAAAQDSTALQASPRGRSYIRRMSNDVLRSEIAELRDVVHAALRAWTGTSS